MARAHGRQPCLHVTPILIPIGGHHLTRLSQKLPLLLRRFRFASFLAVSLDSLRDLVLTCPVWWRQAVGTFTCEELAKLGAINQAQGILVLTRRRIGSLLPPGPSPPPLVTLQRRAVQSFVEKPQFWRARSRQFEAYDEVRLLGLLPILFPYFNVSFSSAVAWCLFSLEREEGEMEEEDLNS